VLRPFFVSRRAMDARVIIVMTAVALLSYALLYTSDAIQSRSQAFLCAALIAAAFFIRGLMLDCRTSDFLTFLNDWVAFFARHGGLAGLSFSVGNYNIPYLYYLAVFSGSTIDDLYLIKILSICFDVILAWSGMRLAGLFVKGSGRRLACFFGILFLPTVVINGALWGQCDSIYTAFAVLGLYLGLSRRPWGSVICIALSFAFKLQAVFVMPVYALLLMSGRIKPKHLLAFPAAYIVSVLPAVIAGRPFWDTLTLYFNQASSVGEGVNYNSSSIFSLIQLLRRGAVVGPCRGLVLPFRAGGAVRGLPPPGPAGETGLLCRGGAFRRVHPLPAAAYARPLLLLRRRADAYSGDGFA
jgi:Gpi18-like mannosyltransferase